MSTSPTHSNYLLSLGSAVLRPYTQLPGCVCAAITGSSAEGYSDEFSDLDMTVYYESLPAEADLRDVRAGIAGAADGPLTWSAGSHAEGEIGEGFRVKGVECQIGHTTVERWEADMQTVLSAKEIATPLHKAMSGTLVSVPVFGEGVLEIWKTRLRAFPDSLAVAMARHYLRFFAVWGVIDRLERRDAGLWVRQTLVDSSFNVLGTLAGLNRQYFTSFQFKRTGAFIRALAIAPAGLELRLAALWESPIRRAAADLRTLVQETAELVERHMPEVDTSACRKALTRDDKAWRMA